jgi:superfamily II DNA or RNA helicase
MSGVAVAYAPQHILPGSTDCAITIRGHKAFITGRFPVRAVRNATSYYVEGFQFNRAYRNHVWDGKKHFFEAPTQSFPAGLVNLVIDAFREYDPGGRVRLVDETLAQMPAIGNHGFDLAGIDFGKGAFDYQLAAANELVKGRRGVLKIATNGGKTEIAIAVTKHLALPTIFIVDSVSLLTQTRRRFAARLGLPEEEIGLIGDQQFSVGRWITVATPDSLRTRMTVPDVQEGLTRWQVLWADECHHVAAETFYEVLARIPAYYRFGLSGTPLDRADGADLKLLAATGPVLYEVPNKLLVERGISVPPHVDMIKIQLPVLPAKKGLTWREVEARGVVDNPHLNEAVAAKALEQALAGKQVLVLVDKTKQARTVQALINGGMTVTPEWSPKLRAVRGHKLVTEYISGKDDGEIRDNVLSRFKNREINIIIATTILDEGVDVPNIDVLILAAGGKGKRQLLQRVGRGLRTGVGKVRLLVIDFANFCHPWLIRHSLARLRTYKGEDCFMISAI